MKRKAFPTSTGKRTPVRRASQSQAFLLSRLYDGERDGHCQAAILIPACQDAQMGEKMDKKNTPTEEITEGLFRFIDDSPTAFHAAANAAAALEKAGYVRITGEEAAGVKPGGKYYSARNDSALIAFRLPEGRIKRPAHCGFPQ